MKVNIHTIERGQPDFDSARKNINWESSSDRKWLMNHLMWAMHNNHVVTLTPGFEQFNQRVAAEVRRV